MQPRGPSYAPPLCPQPIGGCLSRASVPSTSARSSPAAAPFVEAVPFWKRFPGEASISWGETESRKVHPSAEKRFEVDPEFEDQVCPLTILQMGKPEAQGRESPD